MGVSLSESYHSGQKTSSRVFRQNQLIFVFLLSWYSFLDPSPATLYYTLHKPQLSILLLLTKQKQISTNSTKPKTQIYSIHLINFTLPSPHITQRKTKQNPNPPNSRKPKSRTLHKSPTHICKMTTIHKFNKPST